jgi:hypothetical protein
MITPLSYYDLVEAFPAPGCAICRLVLRDVEKYLDGILYEYVMEADTQHRYRAARGMCNQHGWQLTTLSGGAMGIAVLTQVTVNDLLKLTAQDTHAVPAALTFGERLRTRTRGDNAGKALADALEPTGDCPACVKQEAAQTAYLSLFDRYLDDERFFAAYQTSQGLCLPHLRSVLRDLGTSRLVGQVIAVQRRVWAQLHADLEAFQANYRNENRHLAMGAEGDSWLRGVGTLIGDRGAG